MIPKLLTDALRAARRVTVLTGAGISAESGVPTFRDTQSGLWAKYRPEDLATPEAFHRNPRLVWEWYAWRRDKLKRVKPNAGHRALAQMEEVFPDFILVTQNVDGLHRRAGTRRIIELHGNIHRVKCFKENHLIEDWEGMEGAPPRCPMCGGLLRPDIVWFGEPLPESAFQAASRAAAACDLFLAVGTSAVVYPAAALPLAARESGAAVVEINPETTPLTPHAKWSLRGPAGEILPRLLRAAGR